MGTHSLSLSLSHQLILNSGKNFPYLSIYPSIYLFIYIYLSAFVYIIYIDLSIYLSICYLSTHLSVYPFIHLSIHLSIYLSWPQIQLPWEYTVTHTRCLQLCFELIKHSRYHFLLVDSGNEGKWYANGHNQTENWA